MKQLLLFFSLLLLNTSVFAQEQSFTVKVSNDTVLLGNYTIVEFTATNVKGEFEAPYLDNFEIISGPNVSTIVSIINGESTRKSTNTYYLKPKNEGDTFIDSASFYTENDTLKTMPYKIVVLPNPEGKIIKPKQFEDSQFEFSQPNFNFDFFQREPNKQKKRPKKKKKLRTRKL